MAAGTNGMAIAKDPKEKWVDTVNKAQAAAKVEKRNDSADPKSPASEAASEHKDAQDLDKASLISAVTWDVFSPPPSNSFKVCQREYLE